jgi:hypothetical protein
MEGMNPFAQRDALNPVCPSCGRPKRVTHVLKSRRGNFQHGAVRAVYTPVGVVCTCADFAPAMPTREALTGVPEKPDEGAFGRFMQAASDALKDGDR